VDAQILSSYKRRKSRKVAKNAQNRQNRRAQKLQEKALADGNRIALGTADPSNAQSFPE